MSAELATAKIGAVASDKHSRKCSATQSTL